VTTSVETLRAAASLMRERAVAANTDEARRPYGDPLFYVVPETQWGKLVGDEYLGGVIGQHCASWTPAVALAVADLLDGIADFNEANDLDTPSGPLAIAHAYLGGGAR
jgi:hypothetical protein